MTARAPDPDQNNRHSVRQDASTDALAVTPSLGVALEQANMPRRSTLVDRRVLIISALAVALGVAAAFIAQTLVALIGLCTNVAFYGRLSFTAASPAHHHLGGWVVVVPAIGGLIVGALARWGSAAIRGHGIPEAMEQILRNESKIQPRVTFLKPLSSAISIGTGGPFGAEGPIIATGGALGSLVGQLLRVTTHERKVLLAAGAAAGMAAIFAAPISATLLAVELLLFELRPRSLIPVALATVTATGVRFAMVGSAAIFAMPNIAIPGAGSLAFYVALGALIGILSVAITRAVYAVEDQFAKLPVHWMWWPAIGGLLVGAIGYFAPLTLGVGYDNISNIVNGQLGFAALLFLGLMKLLSWSIALGSGTSGGTLAPLFTIGGALGAVAGIATMLVAPRLGVDPRIAGLVGMAAMFAGASRALLTSVVFAFETTRQFAGLLPLLGGCTAAYLVSALTMRTTIMTEKISRRGVHVPDEYSADYLEQVRVGDACVRQVVTLNGSDSLEQVRQWLYSDAVEAKHQGYPLVDDSGRLCGVLTRRDLLTDDGDPSAQVSQRLARPALVVQEHHSLRQAADHMVDHNVGRLVVVGIDEPHRIVGILTRGDILAAHARRLQQLRSVERHISLRKRKHNK